MGVLSQEQFEAIREEVFHETQLIYERAGFKAQRIAKELATIAFSDIKNYLTVNDDGSLTITPLDTIKPCKSHAIKKIRETTTTVKSNDGDRISTTSKIEFELYDKLRAMEMGVEYAGLKPATKTELTGKGGGPIPVTNFPPTAASLDDWQRQMEAAESARIGRESASDVPEPGEIASPSQTSRVKIEKKPVKKAKKR
jgi:hypothetical protein